MRKLGLFLLMLLGFALISSLYVIKTRTQSAYQEVRRMEKLIENERAAITVLNAEIAHLESPARLRGLGDSILGLRPTEVDQVMTLDELAVAVPARDIRKLGGVNE